MNPPNLAQNQRLLDASGLLGLRRVWRRSVQQPGSVGVLQGEVIS